MLDHILSINSLRRKPYEQRFVTPLKDMPYADQLKKKETETTKLKSEPMRQNLELNAKGYWLLR